MKLKVLLFDIETAPYLAAIWHPAQRWVSLDQMLDQDFMLTWSARWLDEKKIISYRLTPEEARNQDDTRIVRALADLVREADVVIAHNIDKFDIPRLNSRVVFHQDEPLGPVETIDTLKLSKKNFSEPHHSLDALAQKWGVGEKIDTDMMLWIDCMAGNKRALKEMEKYNRHDIVLLEGVFNRMRPHVKRLKRLFEADRDFQFLCTNCGAEGIENFMRRGFYRTQASTFQKWQCKNPDCGRYYRDRVSIKSKRARLYPL